MFEKFGGAGLEELLETEVVVVAGPVAGLVVGVGELEPLQRVELLPMLALCG